MSDDLEGESYRPGFEIVDSKHRPLRFVDREGREWFQRCADCNMGLPSIPVQRPEHHKPGCPQRDSA